MPDLIDSPEQPDYPDAGDYLPRELDQMETEWLASQNCHPCPQCGLPCEGGPHPTLGLCCSVACKLFQDAADSRAEAQAQQPKPW